MSLQHLDGKRVIIATIPPTASRPEQSMLKLQHCRRLLVDQLLEIPTVLQPDIRRDVTNFIMAREPPFLLAAPTCKVRPIFPGVRVRDHRSG